MKIEELEKILGDKPHKMRDMLKFTCKTDKPLRPNAQGVYTLFPGVPCEILKAYSLTEYQVMVKARSLKAYLKTLKQNK